MSMTQRDQRPADVVRWDPFDDIQQLQQQLSRVFQSWPRLNEAISAEFTPLADVEESDDAFLIEMELPGIKKDEINIEVSGRRLIVTGERRERERAGVLRRRSRVVGRFRYELILGAPVNDGKVDATLEDGVLTIKIPKAQADRPHRIAVR